MFGRDKKDPPEQPAADAAPESADEAELRQLAAEVAVLEAEEQAAKAAAAEPDPEPEAKPLRMIGVPMRAPGDVSSVSHDGMEFVIPADGICDVPVPAIEAFRAMGFVQVEE